MKKVAIITGASSGLGEEFAIQLARQGFKVGLLARRTERLQDLAKRIGDAGGVADFEECDVTVEDQVRSTIALLEDRLGPADLLIANAGINTGTRVENFKLDAIKRVYDVNVYGALNPIAAVIPGMMQRKSGRIAVISSVASFRGFPIKGAYCGSKAAIRVHMEGLRSELAAYGVSVTTICPGFIKSEMTDQLKINMPFLLDTDVAVSRMLRVIEKKKALMVFPLPMAMLIGVLRMIPSGLFTWYGAWQKKRNKKLAMAN